MDNALGEFAGPYGFPDQFIRGRSQLLPQAVRAAPVSPDETLACA